MGTIVPYNVSAYIKECLNILNKPQRKHFLTYICGLIWIIKFRSIREISRHCGNGLVDSLHHFMKSSASRELEQRQQESITKELKGQSVLLNIDDTPCPRKGKHIEGIGIHHGANGFVKGLCAVTAILKTQTHQFAWCIRPYVPKAQCNEGTFKSKITIAIDILASAQKCFTQPVTVLMDAWYTCAPVLNSIIAAEWTFVAAIKQNRKILVDGKETRVRHLAKGPRQYKTIRQGKRRFRIAKRIVYLPRVGMVALFICKYGTSTKSIVSNMLNLSTKELVALYRERFEIELFHKDIKQHLGFGELFVRSLACVQKHWILVVIAYNIVQLWKNSQTHSFRKKIFHIRATASYCSLTSLPHKLKLAA